MLFFALKLHGAGVFALFEHLFIGLQYRHFYFGVFVAGCRHLLLFRQARLDGLEVFQLQFGVDDFLVADGVDAAIDMADVVVFKTAQHMDDGVGLADVAQKLVAKTLALGGSLDKACNIHYLAGGGNYSSGMDYLCQTGETLVGHGDDAHIGFYRTERKVGCLCLGT